MFRCFYNSPSLVNGGLVVDERLYDPRPYDSRYSRDYRDDRRGGRYDDSRGGGRHDDRDRYYPRDRDRDR